MKTSAEKTTNFLANLYHAGWYARYYHIYSTFLVVLYVPTCINFPGTQLHFPVHLPWGQVQRLCTSLRVKSSMSPSTWSPPWPWSWHQHCHCHDPGIRSSWSFRGLTNAYSPVYWCSTKVDINGFHIRGPFSKPGVGSCYSLNTCSVRWFKLNDNLSSFQKYVGYCDHTCPKVNFVF